jgi:hypothetical protein
MAVLDKLKARARLETGPLHRELVITFETPFEKLET